MYRDGVVMIDKLMIEVSGASGGAGVATANAESGRAVEGEIVAVHVEYVGSPPSTTDVVIETVQSPAMPILTLTNANSDGWFYPVASVVDQDGAAVTDGYVPIVVNDAVKVTVSGANNDDGATVTIVWRG